MTAQNRPPAKNSRSYGHWIDGQERFGSSFIDRLAPQSGLLVARFSEGTSDDVTVAVASAKRTFEAGLWSRLPGIERSQVLSKWAALVAAASERLAGIEVDEAGKTLRLARGDLAGAVELISYAAALCQQVSGQAFMDIAAGLNAFVVKEPAGVVGAIIPWNFPTIIFAQKIPFALAAGCSVVVKPSELTSGTALELAKLAKEAGVPDGVLNVVTGYGNPVGKDLAASPDVDVVSFTGSTRTGREILKGQQVNFKRVSLELGGKSAAIVFADADLDAAVAGVLFSIFLHQGQVCCAGSRLLVEADVADEFIARLARRAAALRRGDPHDPDTDIGPLVSPTHLHLVAGHVEAARQAGARVVCGGEIVAQLTHPDAPPQTYLPTILDQVSPQMHVYQEEIFGPVLTVTRFSSKDEAVRLANQSNYGLAGSVWTQDLDTAFFVASRVRTGTIEINTSLEGKPQLPFGGYKASGLGREKGVAGLEEFMETKTIGLRVTPRPDFFPRR